MDRGFRLLLILVGCCFALQEAPAQPWRGSSQPHPAEVRLGTSAMLSGGAGAATLAPSKNQSEPATSPLESQSAQRPPLRGLQWPDWLAVALYAALVLGIGLYYSRLQTSTEEYFVASRNMRASVAGISLMATLLSAISYLATPGEMIKHGPTVFWQLGAYPLVFFLVGYSVIPIFTRLPITSAYELLEQRLGLQGRLVAASMFILVRLTWMGLVVYLAAKAVVEMLGWDPSTVPYAVAVAGAVAVVYTALGGAASRHDHRRDPVPFC